METEVKKDKDKLVSEYSQKIEEIKVEKNKVVRSQKYEEAAKLRDTEKHLLEELEKAKGEWEAETKTKRYTVTDDNVAEVVSMMTGIPVQRDTTCAICASVTASSRSLWPVSCSDSFSFFSRSGMRA